MASTMENITDIAYSIVVAAGMVFVFFVVFGFIDALVEIFLVSE